MRDGYRIYICVCIKQRDSLQQHGRLWRKRDYGAHVGSCWHYVYLCMQPDSRGSGASAGKEEEQQERVHAYQAQAAHIYAP